MRVLCSDCFALQLPPGHRLPISKHCLLCDRVVGERLQVQIEQAPAAADADLALAHNPAYVDDMAVGRLSDAEMRAIGLPRSDLLVERSGHSVGATVAAARAAICDVVAVQLAGGTHPAHAERGGGFCVFSCVAVPARRMQAEYRRHPHGRFKVL